jgi:hypothetical protein
MTNIFSTPNLIYWIVIAITVTLTTATLGQLWKRRENARWTTGYAVVFIWGYFLVYLGYWDGATYIGLFFAVGISGAIKVGYEQYRHSREAAKLRREGVSHGPSIGD